MVHDRKHWQPWARHCPVLLVLIAVLLLMPVYLLLAALKLGLPEWYDDIKQVLTAYREERDRE